MRTILQSYYDKVNTPDSLICRIMRFARLKPMQNFSLMPEAINLFSPRAYATTSSNKGSQLLLSKVLFSIGVHYIYGLQSGKFQVVREEYLALVGQ